MAVILSAGVYSANIANAIQEQAASYGWEISLFETVSVRSRNGARRWPSCAPIRLPSSP